MRFLVPGALAALACQPVAGAIAGEMPAEIAAAIKQIGPVIDLRRHPSSSSRCSRKSRSGRNARPRKA